MVAAIVLFRSQRADNALTGDDETAIRALLERYGKDDSLGYFATRRDKSVVFAPNGRAAITYRVEVGVCLASGDPVGDPRAWPAAIAEWLRLCLTYGWAPGVMGASATGAKAFADAGINALELGDEAILYPDRFKLSGPDMAPVRQAVTRARRAGLTVRIRRHRDLSAAEMAEVIAHADACATPRPNAASPWRWAASATRETATAAGGGVREGGEDPEVVAMLSLVPWAATGVSLDLMRRSRPVPQRHHRADGQRARAAVERLGLSRISLNFAMLRSAFEEGAQLGAGPVARL
ncbi:phosphatidylglycerol lysyltransferase domain-containing protein [Mycolicibacterium insubricum]|uniref:phosphatidylglycerol lysyltransferase domain-containing protein n=1 Tax=Mycolicibacterium insubricum TaxID=444597 RepID=UPI0024B38199